MARPSTIHVCSSCGHTEARWHGQCPGCGEWNTLVEERAPAVSARGGGGAVARRGGGGPAITPVALREVTATAVARLSTGIGELDRVLGGGLVPGSLVLLGGSPGIGKSTLTNMVLANLQGAGRRTLYVSGEESAEQVRLRAERLAPPAVGSAVRLAAAPAPALDVPVLAETELETILDVLAREAPDVCVIDSVQTLRAAELSGAPGSVGQV